VGPGSSRQHLDATAKAIVTTKACAKLNDAKTDVKGWFRWMPSSDSNLGHMSAASTCSEGGAPHTARGSLAKLRLTGVHGAWAEAGEALPDAGVGRPCAALQQQRVRPHDYCLPMARFAHAPANETIWHGVALVGNERHTDNFHHFNRDMLFVARVLSRGLLRRDEISHVLLPDASDLVGWAIEHARVVLGAHLLRRTVFAPRRSGGLQPQKASLSPALITSSTSSTSTASTASRTADARGTDALARVPAGRARYVCFAATVEKLVTDPVDRDDLAWLRARAYTACAVPGHPRRSSSTSGDSHSASHRQAAADAHTAASDGRRLLLLVLRGDVRLHDRPSVARQMGNGDAVTRALDAFAASVGLRLHTTAFAGMSYCEQVRLVASAQMMVGIHGQGLTNGQFMPDDGLVVELFHGGERPHWSAFDNVGHQPLFVGAGAPPNVGPSTPRRVRHHQRTENPKPSPAAALAAASACPTKHRFAALAHTQRRAACAGRPYVAAPYAESACLMMQWKHTPGCKSYVNVSRARLARQRTARDARPECQMVAHMRHAAHTLVSHLRPFRLSAGLVALLRWAHPRLTLESGAEDRKV
jgi:hypothetical protein